MLLCNKQQVKIVTAPKELYKYLCYAPPLESVCMGVLNVQAV
jgi:hypothetical protein